MERALLSEKLRPIKHAAMLGRPDFVFRRAKVAVFCDSHFWHGFNWKIKKRELLRNRAFWVAKISANIRRDRLVNRRLRKNGWNVVRFWEHQILRSPERCAAKVKEAITMRRNKT
jgi:DNA mismatch endonuclease (patch repair protein)